ncbi:MAG TPA: glycosyltransferase family 39 protein, partial [Polyangiaceae bacterium]|nr:glycosyltransferase family 39 protein [Polyangiaceae bacterium]
MRADRQESVAKLVVTVSTVWFALAVTWGLFGAIGGGHWAIVGSRGIMGDNMVTWGIWGPVRDYTFGKPTPQLYYVHHPWGTYWVIGALTKLCGRHAFVPRLEPVLMSIATPPLLYGVGRALWGPVPGALSALAFVVLPIALAFGNFPGFEVPLNFGCLLAAWGYLRFQQRWQRRWMAVSLVGVAWSINSDWESAVFLALVMGVLIVQAYWLPAWLRPDSSRRVDPRRFGQWWSIAFVIVVVTIFGYLAYIQHIGAVDDFFSQEAKREKGNDLPLSAILDQRRYWIDVCFTPLAIAVGKLAVPIFLFRLFLLRRPLEIFPLAFLAMATVEYVNFKNGADVHTFWPLPFAPYWALSVGVLAETAIDLARFTALRLDVTLRKDAIALGVLAVIGLLPLLVLPDGVRGLVYARTSGGRFNDRGRRIFQDVDKSEAAAWFGQRMQGAPRVLIHSTLHTTWAIDWAMRRPTATVDTLPDRPSNGEDRYLLGDLAFMKPADQQKIAAQFHLTTVGQFVLVDRGSPPAPADAYAFDEREPTAAEWYLFGGTEPMRTVRPDAWATWELRDEFGQTPNPLPGASPATLDELRVAHNAAVASGDAGRAGEYQTRLLARLDARPSTKFSDGTVLLGERFKRGADPILELYFLAPGPSPVPDRQFEIQSVVQSAPFGS